ncbi:MAG TPA: MlaD family protein [Bacteroidota bacterium]|nr:MlaD family protein [Bacteroidota bacterium]
MKTNTSKNIRLGMFISLGIALFIFAIFFIGGEQQLFTSTFRISGVFKDVAGLQAGNNVRLAGTNVGTVDNISIVSDTTVRVDILIDEKTRKFIKKDAVASIGSEGLMGNKVLIITPGTGGQREIENNDTVGTSLPTSFDNVLISLKTTLDNTSNITNDLSKITYNIQSGKGTVGKLLMDQALRKDFDSTFVNLKEGSAHFRRFMEKGNDLDNILISLKTAMDNTATITGDLSKITSNIQSGQGTIGRLLMDQSLQQNVDSTIIYLKESSAGLKRLTDKAKHSWLLWGF